MLYLKSQSLQSPSYRAINLVFTCISTSNCSNVVRTLFLKANVFLIWADRKRRVKWLMAHRLYIIIQHSRETECFQQHSLQQCLKVSTSAGVCAADAPALESIKEYVVWKFQWLARPQFLGNGQMTLMRKYIACFRCQVIFSSSKYLVLGF